MADLLAQRNARLFGAYELLDKIGQGGMSKVYQARDTRNNAIVAIKIASHSVINDRFLRRRFELEFDLVRPLSHPQLVKVLDYGTQDKVPYLVMEYIDGPSLMQRLETGGPLNEHDALAIALPIADAVAYLHQKHIIHRDIKPANILLPSAGPPRLADLGLIKNLDSISGLTRSKLGLGTMQFASTEQFDDARSADGRSDVYSLAVTLYLALTGEYPFGQGSMLNIMSRKMKNQFERPSAKVPELRTCVDHAIRRAMDADREKRPASMREFIALLTGEIKPRREPTADAAPKAKAPAKGTKELRRARRFGVEMKAACRAAVNLAGQRWPAWITNISQTGICLNSHRRFEVGSVVQVSFSLRTGTGKIDKVARVRWAHPTASKSWLLGCELVESIPEDEMDNILADCMERTRML